MFGTAVVVAILSLHASEIARVSFEIESHAVPVGDSVHVVGNIEDLGEWRHEASLVLQPQDDSTWVGNIAVPQDSSFAFKITRGSWFTEALSEHGKIPADTWVTAGADTIIRVVVTEWKDQISAGGGVTGTVDYLEALPSTILGRSRDIWILLPPSYESEPDRRYPVLYMQDGRNAFDPRLSSSGKDWQVDESVDSLTAAGVLSEFLVVAVDQTPQRFIEYADTTLGEVYAEYLATELKPFIDDHYRTLSDRKSTALMGSSMGGLISFLTAWWYPSVFGQAACLSPAFIWGDDKVIHRVEQQSITPPRPRFYLDVGDLGIEEKLLPGVTRMAALLKASGWEQGKDLQCRFLSNAGHHETAWADRIGSVLQFLFPAGGTTQPDLKGEPCE